jgi:hypothetical protein
MGGANEDGGDEPPRDGSFIEKMIKQAAARGIVLEHDEEEGLRPPKRPKVPVVVVEVVAPDQNDAGHAGEPFPPIPPGHPPPGMPDAPTWTAPEDPEAGVETGRLLG